MNSNIEISIIIPAYNAEATIEECLNKIFEESINLNSEIIVIDDNSSDNTCSIVEKFRNVKLVKLDENKGVGHARNLGAKLAKNKILCYIDSDLIISKNKSKGIKNNHLSDINAFSSVVKLFVKKISN